jgi:hypothetical protein
MANDVSEGLRLARLMMVLGGLSPLFILWALRGLDPIPDVYWIPICGMMVAIPNIVIAARFWIAKHRGERKVLTIGEADDNRDHLLVYLFAMVMPLYDLNVHERREACAMATALVFIVFLFWHLNLHYMNLVFALFGYRVYTVRPQETNDGISGRSPFVVLTRRTVLRRGDTMHTVRISNGVFWECEDE